MNWRRPIFRSFPFVGKTSAAIVAATMQAAAAYAEPSTVTNIFKPLSTPAESIYQSAILVLLICAAIFPAERLAELQGLLESESGDHNLVLDLNEVKLVDRAAITFLGACEAKGVKLRNCPAFIREWIEKETA